MRPQIYVPGFNSLAFPYEERRTIYFINATLSSLAEYAKDIGAAFQLFADSRARQGQEWWDRWVYIAGRDGAMSIYHFGETLRGLRSCLKGCPVFAANVDHKALREAEKRFKKCFPVARNMRIAIAHSAELADSVDSLRKNSLDDHFDADNPQVSSKGPILIRNHVINNTFNTTFEGSLIKYTISTEVFSELLVILQAINSAFAKNDLHLPKEA